MQNIKIVFAALLFCCCLGFTLKEKQKVLIIGDSISIGYFPFVQRAFGNEVLVVHNEGNAQHTGTGLEKIHDYLHHEKWDVIHFNWGLWDLCYRDSASGNQGHRDKKTGKVEFTTERYANNLEALVAILQKTGAKLIFATTTVVPPNELGRVEGDEKKYNEVALNVMRRYNVQVDDLNKVSYGIHEKCSAGDGNVHFTPEGYRQLAEVVTASIREALHN